MKLYKGFDKNLKCRGFQYEIGKEYEEDSAELCSSGFHACENPLDVFGYYPPADSRYCEVELEDVSEEVSDDSNRCGKRIKIGAEIGIKGIVDAFVKFTLERADWSAKRATNTGDQSAATNTGYYSAATNTGYYSAATNTGYYSAATNTGYRSAATNTGDYSAATNTGDQSAATNTGYYSAATNTGYYSAATNTGYLLQCRYQHRLLQCRYRGRSRVHCYRHRHREQSKGRTWLLHRPRRVGAGREL